MPIVFFDTDPAYACVRVLHGRAADLPRSARDAREVAAEALPDRAFRNAWRADLGIDMARARAIHLARIRAARDAELARADAAMARAQDQADSAETGRLRARRQELRDLPQTFDLAQYATADALAAAWPAALPRG